MAKRIEFNEATTLKGVTTLIGREPFRVVAEIEGPVTFRQKVKNYYKGITVLVGVLTMALSDAAFPEPVASWVFVAVGVLTPILTILKANEKWVDDL